jgi:hypothetical protein
MELKELINVKLGCLYDLRLADVHVLQRVNAPCGLLNLSANRLRHKLLYKLLQVARRRLAVHDLEHFLSDLPNLRRLRVRRLPDLVRATLGERDGEESDEVAIGRLYINVSFDQGLPLADERAELVGGEVHAMEVCQTVLPLHFINAQLDLAEAMVFVLSEVSERDLDDPTLERVVCIFCAFLVNTPRSNCDNLLHVLRPCERFTSVLPTFFTSKKDGPLISYHSAAPR